MTGWAYYNEFDPFAAQWLRELIKAGNIAPGIVDERSIEDVRPDELAGYAQCHFFAGIGGWPLALRQAGWPDDKPVWTGSCPCQPFSAAGKGAGFDDERHLWPAFQWLIQQCRPPVVFGEQVASKATDPWVDIVQADLEAMGYAFGCVAFPAAGVGAPHIRDRAYWVGHAIGAGLEGLAGHGDRAGRWAQPDRSTAETGGAGGVADSASQRWNWREDTTWATGRPSTQDGRDIGGHDPAGPTNGHWGAADWLLCRDGKWRPVESLPQQMADGLPESLGRLRECDTSEITKEVMLYAEEAGIDAREAMLDVWMSLGQETIQRTTGRFNSVQEAPFLLSLLRQLTDQGWEIAQSLPRPSAEAPEKSLRVLWERVQAARASHQRGLDGQPAGEHPDAVRVLSSILARHTQAAWGEVFDRHVADAFPLLKGAASRVGRLRGYGNAIAVPQAQIFIESVNLRAAQ